MKKFEIEPEVGQIWLRYYQTPEAMEKCFITNIFYKSKFHADVSGIILELDGSFVSEDSREY